ncbi:sensor histidine kinase [Undibacterium sp. TJN19]|uniref:sensor histidine kinase n=1 Tax=Undibacterium sp. TJN19 TaxID=3413055 RepID=UPI003BF40F38
MENVLRWRRQFARNRLGLAGILLTLFITGIDTVQIWMRGPQADDLHSLAGLLVVWLASQFTSAPSLISAGSDRAELVYQLFICLNIASGLLFALLLWLRTQGLKPVSGHQIDDLLSDRQNKLKKRATLLKTCFVSLQLLLAISVDSGLLFLLAAELAVIMPRNKGICWLMLQMLLFSIVTIYTSINIVVYDSGLRLRLLYLAGELTVQGLIYAGTYVTLLERRGRLVLAAANAELRATQSMLADTVRASERIRIARDLHDAVGHHLTALNLHLDLAVRQAEPQRETSLRTSSELARALLAEVRAVVDVERLKPSIHLRHALRALCEGMPYPDICLLMEENLEINSPAAAHTIFCCIQEAISNVVKHAQADNLLINIEHKEDDLLMSIRDDGVGNTGAAEGNGLRGMRERLAELGGSLHLEHSQKHGFALTLSIPYTRCMA